MIADKLLRWSRTGSLTLLRVFIGGVMVAHGATKLWDLAATQSQFASMGIPVPAVAAPLAVLGEVGGGLGLALGLLTPISGLLVAVTMAVAIGYVHLAGGLFARDGGFEYPLLALLVSLHFTARGAGPVSVDALLARRDERDDLAAAGLGRHPDEVAS